MSAKGTRALLFSLLSSAFDDCQQLPLSVDLLNLSPFVLPKLQLILYELAEMLRASAGAALLCPPTEISDLARRVRLLLGSEHRPDGDQLLRQSEKGLLHILRTLGTRL